MKHVDDFIYELDFSSEEKNINYAKWVLNHFRLPALLKNKFDEFMKDKKLFGTYKGKKYRITGASRMGDVWLAEDFDRKTGYDLRVDVDNISDWSNQ